MHEARTSWTAMLRRLLRPTCLGVAMVASLLACRDSSQELSANADASTPIEAQAPTCPDPVDGQIREVRAPDIRAEHERAAYWLAKLPADLVERELLDASEREQLARAVAELPGGWRDPLDPSVVDPALIERELGERLAWLRERVRDGKYVETEPGALERAAARIESATIIEGTPPRFVVSETPLWCVPSAQGLYTEPVDLDFDRNRCASLHPGELVRTLRISTDGAGSAWLYVDAGHSVGWVEQRPGMDVTLGPELVELVELMTLGPALGPDEHPSPRLWLTKDFEDLRAGSSFPLVTRDTERQIILVPGIDGPHERELPLDAPVSEGPLPFTPRHLYEQAFALLDHGYGWGGRDGLRDCSRYLLDLFAEFDIRLPRNSAVQAKLGTRSVDLSELDEDQKRAQIRAAAQTGVVLLYMPGHIMLYLGHDGEHDYGISALSEYLTPCPGGPDTIHRLDKVAVTTLDLGRDTQRRAFIERITRMAVFE